MAVVCRGDTDAAVELSRAVVDQTAALPGVRSARSHKNAHHTVRGGGAAIDGRAGVRNDSRAPVGEGHAAGQHAGIADIQTIATVRASDTALESAALARHQALA